MTDEYRPTAADLARAREHMFSVIPPEPHDDECERDSPSIGVDK